MIAPEYDAPNELKAIRRVALVSGASRGIGEAIAQQLHTEGWQLSLGMRTPCQPSWASEAAAMQCVAYEARAGSAEQHWVGAALEKFGQIDAVVANAGLMIPGNVVEIAELELEAMWEVNVKAPRRLVQAAWPALRNSTRGRVVIVASLSGKRVAARGSSAYSMTKHAAVALAHGIRRTGWDDGIRATALCPGLVSTGMARQITDRPDAGMTSPREVARLASLALDLPDQASLAELSVNCDAGELY